MLTKTVGAAAGFTVAALAALAACVSAALGCSGAFDLGGDEAECGIDSLRGTYRTEVLDDRESDLGAFGINGVSSAAGVDGPFLVTSEVVIESNGRATFTELWVERDGGRTVEFEADGVIRLSCVGDELSSYVLDWGATRVLGSTFENDGFLAAFRVGNVAVDAGPDSSVTIRGEDVSGDRVVTLDVVGPGPMADGVEYRLR